MLDSIRTRLTLWYAGVLTLLIIAFATITYISVSRILAAETDKTLLEVAQNFASVAKDEVANEDDAPSDQEAFAEIIKEFKFQNTHIFVLSNDGKILDQTSDLDLPTDFSTDSYNTFEWRHQRFRVFSTTLTLGVNSYKLLIYGDLAEQIEIKGQLTEYFAILVPVILILAVGLGYWLAKRSLKPVSEIGRQARSISASTLNSRLLVRNERDEIGTLAGVFNDLLERLENSFEQQRRFMADASHELRTPLAIVRGESEVALSKEDRPNSELRESLSIVNDESKRLTKIVEDLFMLSRVDARQITGNFTTVRLDEILADCARSVRVLADKKNVSLTISATETPIAGDEILLRRLFLNLLDNAVKFNREGGNIAISLLDRCVTIADTGCGIPRDEQTKVFDRFYRTDRSRNRGDEAMMNGAGLGLSIAKWIAELHHAELKVARSDETGTVFEVNFPR